MKNKQSRNVINMTNKLAVKRNYTPRILNSLSEHNQADLGDLIAVPATIASSGPDYYGGVIGVLTDLTDDSPFFIDKKGRFP